MTRKPINHVVIMDGTLSSLQPEFESNAGLTYKLLCRLAPSAHMSLFYVEGIQWCNMYSLIDLAAGRGITRQIQKAYGFIAARYRPGDRIFLFGFSRGAYAVRSLAGVIDQIGLLRQEFATQRHVDRVFRHYRNSKPGKAAASFAQLYCHPETPIEMIGVWDTVKSLGIPYPLLWRLAPQPVDFHNAALGPSVRNGFHALALNETRKAFAPVLWHTRPDWNGHLEQAWFRGAHPDVGGQIGGFSKARPLANIPLVWMLEKAESCGLPLPGGWRAEFPTDPTAPAYGTFRGIGKYFLLRQKRRPLQDPSEYIHPSVAESGGKLPFPNAGAPNMATPRI